MARFRIRQPSEHKGLIGVDAALAMLARSGFEAFEHGTGLFDSPLLAYLPTAGPRPAFAIHDHRGVRLGRVRPRVEPPSGRFGQAGGRGQTMATEIRDATRRAVMSLDMVREKFRTVVSVNGKVDATFVHDQHRHHQIDICSAAFDGRGEPDFGLVVDPAQRSMAGAELSVTDLTNRQVAILRSVSAGHSRGNGYALALNAHCEGDLRRCLVALPVVIDAIKVDHGQVIDDVGRNWLWTS